jgi:succinate-semialdehyde dehydrogenase/glutarate-semialdehyde dehydrogenase
VDFNRIVAERFLRKWNVQFDTANNSDEAISLANATPYGLASYLFTRSLKTATMASEAIQAGMVGINELAIASAEMPFGGVKDSGIGREGGSLGVRDYLEAKYIKTRL